MVEDHGETDESEKEVVEDHGETDEEKEEKKKADEAQRKVEEDKAVKQMERLLYLRLAFGRCPKIQWSSLECATASRSRCQK